MRCARWLNRSDSGQAELPWGSAVGWYIARDIIFCFPLFDRGFVHSLTLLLRCSLSSVRAQLKNWLAITYCNVRFCFKCCFVVALQRFL